MYICQKHHFSNKSCLTNIHCILTYNSKVDYKHLLHSTGSSMAKCHEVNTYLNKY